MEGGRERKGKGEGGEGKRKGGQRGGT